MKNGVCFERRWFMCDYARQRSFVREEFSLWLDALARLGYNGIGIYLEGAFDFASIPGVIRDGVMTREDAAWAVENTGHTKADLTLLSETVGVLKRLGALLRESAAVVDRIPLTRFERLLDRAVEGKFICR